MDSTNASRTQADIQRAETRQNVDADRLGVGQSSGDQQVVSAKAIGANRTNCTGENKRRGGSRESHGGIVRLLIQQALNQEAALSAQIQTSREYRENLESLLAILETPDEK